MHLSYIRHLSHGSVMFCRQERQGDLKIALLGKAERGTLDHTWIVLLRGLSFFLASGLCGHKGSLQPRLQRRNPTSSFNWHA